MPPSRLPAVRARALRHAAAVALLAILVAACGVVDPTPPSPTPADFGGIAAALVQAGVKVVHPVSGDAGCDDRVLEPTAISFDASGLDQAPAGPDLPVRVRRPRDVRAPARVPSTTAPGAT